MLYDNDIIIYLHRNEYKPPEYRIFTRLKSQVNVVPKTENPK